MANNRGYVVITGASTGIGEACALRLAGSGFHVFAGVRRDEDGARLLAQASPETLTPLMIDVTDEASIAKAASTVIATAGDRGIAGLVNNAGISVTGPLEFLPLARFRQQMEVNVTGQIAVTQAFMPLVRKARGRVVFMGSIGGRMSSPFLGPYSASKFALEAITDSMRVELRPWGIHVSIVEPGSIATPIWEKALSTADEIEREIDPAGVKLYEKSIAALRKTAKDLGARGIPADEVAKVVEHALTAKTPKTRYIVGRDAKMQAILLKFAPDRLRDRAVARVMGLPSKP